MNAQVKKGVLKLCVLALLEGRDWYGYEISDYLTRLIDIADGSVYPLLRRLQKDGCLTSFWQETAEGLPPRKYYEITGAGREYLSAMRREWDELNGAIEALKGDGENE